MNKGFMHAVEGIIAAILVLSYTASVLEYPTDTNEWSTVKQKQVGREFLSALEGADLSHIVVEDRASAFSEISGYFLGMGKSYGVTTEGLLPRNIVVGVVSNESRKETALGPYTCSDGAYSEYWCYTGSFKGLGFVLVDNDTGVGNSIEDYDSIYFDSNGDGNYDEYEGPKKISSAFNASGEIWVFYSVNNLTHEVEFINGADYINYRKNLDKIVLNGRLSELSVRAITNRSELNEIDLLIIPQYMSLVNIKARIEGFLDEGNAIIEVANITPSRIDGVQRDIFGLRAVDYGVIENPIGGVDFESRDIYGISEMIDKYYDNTLINVGMDSRIVYLNTTWTVPSYEFDCYIENKGIYFGHVNCTNLAGPNPCSSFDATGLVEHVDESAASPACWIGTSSTRNIYRYGNISFRKNIYFGMSINYSGVGYDRIAIDFNRDMNLTNDGGFLREGDTIYFGASGYVIANILDDGTGFELHPLPFNEFVKGGYEKLYSNNNETEYVVLESPDVYSSTTLNIGEKITVDTPTTGLPCDLGGVSASEYQYNSTPWLLPYTFVIMKISSGFNALAIDVNNDGRCDGYNEGLFYSGDNVRVGPEYYRIDVALDGNHVNWTLVDRWHVPYAIANHKNGYRRAVWINGDIDSLDEWHIVKSVVVWAANKKSNMLLASDALDTVVVKSVFVEDTDMFQPYGVYFRMGSG